VRGGEWRQRGKKLSIGSTSLVLTKRRLRRTNQSRRKAEEGQNQGISTTLKESRDNRGSPRKDSPYGNESSSTRFFIGNLSKRAQEKRRSTGNEGVTTLSEPAAEKNRKLKNQDYKWKALLAKK